MYFISSLPGKPTSSTLNYEINWLACDISYPRVLTLGLCRDPSPASLGPTDSVLMWQYPTVLMQSPSHDSQCPVGALPATSCKQELIYLALFKTLKALFRTNVEPLQPPPLCNTLLDDSSQDAGVPPLLLRRILTYQIFAETTLPELLSFCYLQQKDLWVNS